jgi:tetratricopeptide (TPR) repeat protein
MKSSSSKLSSFCGNVLEIGWLLAVIITPLFFNVYSSRVFEPDKLTTLRTLALIMAAVWLVRYIEERASGRYESEITWHTSLVFPTIFIVVVYILSTILSVTPWVSLLGSYQRLQGTFTTVSYIVIFFVVLQELRTREQADRLITVVIVNSLPISLYGLVQRNGLDPLPWGGNVSNRIASNMGNAIFVAAYLIMATFPTLARVVKAFRSILTDEEANAADIPRAAVYIFVLLVQLIATFYTQSRGPLLGLLAGLGIWGFLGLLALQQAARREQPLQPSDLPKDLGWGLVFGFGSLAAAAVAAVLFYFAGNAIVGPESSLPQGIAAVVAVLVLLGFWLTFIVNRKGWRWLWASALVLAVFASVGFFAINPGGPLYEWSQQQPSLRRVSRVLDPARGTGMVRSLIWQGGLDLFLPHGPIEYPPTQAYPEGRSDPSNGLRPLVGYGPESMYVAYNSFYPPLLGHFESRTASPDRSHNETLDSLIITGVLGFVAYMWLFVSIFYFSLHWLGFLPSDWRRILFFVLLVAGAVIATAVVIPAIGPHFFCLAIPIGMVGGLFLYLIVYGFSVYWEPGTPPKAHPYAVLLIGILSAVVAHFVEINFGIAIASTRTTFWAYAGVLVVAGLGLIRESEEEHERQETENGKRGGEETRRRGRRRKKRRKAAPPPSPAQSALPSWLWRTFAVAIVGGFVLGTLSFDFVTNAERLTQPMRIIWRALTVLPAQQSRTSYGALMIFALTWLMGAIIFISEMSSSGAFRERKGDGWLATLLYMLLSLTVGLGFALVLAGRQASLMDVQAQTLQDVLGIADSVAGFLSAYYWYIVCILLAGGAVLFLEKRRQPERVAYPGTLVAFIVLAVLVGAIAVRYNLTPIKADIVYKQADPYDRGKQWLVSIEHYKHAIELAPKEDFYFLYLGRAYLEYASSLEDPAVRETVMRETEQTLTEAREINPLNTDHSANLARMYRRWADFASDDERKQELLRKSSENYELATMLSPQNAILWNEWTMLYFYGLRDAAGFERALERSLEIDPEFDQTWLVCGDARRQQGELEDAARCYEKALELSPGAPQVWRMLGDTYIAMQEWDSAINALTQTVELQPKAQDIWNIHQVLARLYSQTGQQEQALVYAQTALELAPEDQQESLQALVAQIESLATP